jgi:hypothetical protein
MSLSLSTPQERAQNVLGLECFPIAANWQKA